MKIVTLPNAPDPRNAAYNSNQKAYNKANYDWATQMKSMIERASRIPDTTSSSSVTSTVLGITDFISTVPTSSVSGLNVVLGAGVGVVNGETVSFPEVSGSFADNTITDYWLNSDSTWTIESQPTNNYINLPFHSDKLHVWRISTTGTATVTLMGNTYPTVSRPDDRAATIDTWAEDFYIYQTAVAWGATTSYTYGKLVYTTTGNVYQVAVAGTSGVAAPTSTATGYIVDGSVQYFYYCQRSYLGMIRRGQNNGVEFYFNNKAAYSILHKILVTGSTLGNPAGTTLLSMILLYIKGVFFHIIGNRVNSGTYIQGMKMIAGGYIWLSQTTTGAVAASSPFSGSYTPGVSTVVDGAVTWLCIYTSYSSQQWFWMDTDRTFLTYTSPDSHDSYMSTFASLLARYGQCGGDLTFMTGASTQPSGAGTYWTYQQIFGYAMNANLDTQLSNFLSQTFQSNINPSDGSGFTTQYLEDNAETCKGYRDAAYVYGILGDTTAQTNALSNEAYVGSGVANLYDSTYNMFGYYYGDVVSSWANDPEKFWYPWLQAQFFPEFCHVKSISDDQYKLVRYGVSTRWPAWWDDKAIDSFPQQFLGVLAARNWQDSKKAYAAIEKFDRYYVTGGAITSEEMAEYLLIKDTLTPTYNVLSASASQIFLQSTTGDITLIDKTVPVSLADGAAANNTIYYSLTGSKLSYKDGSGNVHALY